jgi:hypothetical protein
VKLPMPFSPLSLSEVHRRRAMRLAFSSPVPPFSGGERDENAEDEGEEQA